MPYENEHACRLVSPDIIKTDQSLTFKHNGKRYRALVGTNKNTGKRETQAYRYKKSIWDADEARAHCKSKGGTFEAAKRTEQTSVNDTDYTTVENNPLIDFEIT